MNMGAKLVSNNPANEAKHSEAIDALYAKHGVGNTIKQRFAFWESQHPNGYSISHNPTKKQAVMIFEACWLFEQFPQDMKYA